MDEVNGCFEAIAAFFVWTNVRALLRDKQVRGVNLRVNAWYCFWGLNSLWYYWNLGHWFSFTGNVAILLANCTWLGLALYYRKRERSASVADQAGRQDVREQLITGPEASVA